MTDLTLYEGAGREGLYVSSLVWRGLINFILQGHIYSNFMILIINIILIIN